MGRVVRPEVSLSEMVLGRVDLKSLEHFLPVADRLDTGYPHDGRADKDSYPHDGRADKDSYPHDRHNQYIMLSL